MLRMKIGRNIIKIAQYLRLSKFEKKSKSSKIKKSALCKNDAKVGKNFKWNKIVKNVESNFH